MADIELRLQHLDQLFDTLDPAPFHAKPLDRRVEAWLLDSAGQCLLPLALAETPRKRSAKG